MTKGNPMKIILMFSIPVLMGNLFQQFYNVVDSIVAGQFLGVQALAAIGSTLHQKQSTAQSQYGKKGTGHQSRQFRHVYPQDTDGHHRASSTNSIQCARAAARGRDMGGLHVQ